ncbi:MAG: right-handed parallel beta-helix repeat-containing protein [Polyangiaceae bacterium]
MKRTAYFRFSYRLYIGAAFGALCLFACEAASSLPPVDADGGARNDASTFDEGGIDAGELRDVLTSDAKDAAANDSSDAADADAGAPSDGTETDRVEIPVTGEPREAPASGAFPSASACFTAGSRLVPAAAGVPAKLVLFVADPLSGPLPGDVAAGTPSFASALPLVRFTQGNAANEAARAAAGVSNTTQLNALVSATRISHPDATLVLCFRSGIYPFAREATPNANEVDPAKLSRGVEFLERKFGTEVWGVTRPFSYTHEDPSQASVMQYVGSFTSPAAADYGTTTQNPLLVSDSGRPDAMWAVKARTPHSPAPIEFTQDRTLFSNLTFDQNQRAHRDMKASLFVPGYDPAVADCAPDAPTPLPLAQRGVFARATTLAVGIRASQRECLPADCIAPRDVAVHDSAFVDSYAEALFVEGDNVGVARKRGVNGLSVERNLFVTTYAHEHWTGKRRCDVSESNAPGWEGKQTIGLRAVHDVTIADNAIYGTFDDAIAVHMATAGSVLIRNNRSYYGVMGRILIGDAPGAVVERNTVATRYFAAGGIFVAREAQARSGSDGIQLLDNTVRIGAFFRSDLGARSGAITLESTGTNALLDGNRVFFQGTQAAPSLLFKHQRGAGGICAFPTDITLRRNQWKGVSHGILDSLAPLGAAARDRWFSVHAEVVGGQTNEVTCAANGEKHRLIGEAADISAALPASSIAFTGCADVAPVSSGPACTP